MYDVCDLGEKEGSVVWCYIVRVMWVVFCIANKIAGVLVYECVWFGIVASRWNQAVYNASDETCMYCFGKGSGDEAEDN